jgi:DNA-binding transcriptional ArsR family regulator
MLLAQADRLDLKARLHRGFGDRSRLSILEKLRAGASTVGEIAEASGLSPSNTSNHLACLRECGLVVAEPEGRFVRYRLSDTRVAALLEISDELLQDVARDIYYCTQIADPTGELP